MPSIQKLAKNLYNRDKSVRLQAFSTLIQMKKIETNENDMKNIIQLLLKEPQPSVGEWDHPKQTLLLFLKHYPALPASNMIIPTYPFLRPVEKGLLLELLLQWETTEGLTAFFQFLKADYAHIPIIDLFPLLQQLHIVGINFTHLLPVMQYEPYQDFLLYLYFEAKKGDYLLEDFDEDIAILINKEFPRYLAKLLEYEDDYEVRFVHGPWKSTYIPLRNHIKIFLRTMYLINRAEFSDFYKECVQLKDVIVASEAWMNLWALYGENDERALEKIGKSYEGRMNLYQAYSIRDIKNPLPDLPFSFLQLIESHLVYRLVNVEKIPYHTISIVYVGIEEFDSNVYHIYKFTSTESPWEEEGELYAFCGPFTTSEANIDEIKEAFTKIYTHHMPYEAFTKKLKLYHDETFTTSTEYFGTFRHQLPFSYLLGFVVVAILLLIQIIGNNNYITVTLYSMLLLYLTYALAKRYTITKMFRFVMNSNIFSYYCGKKEFKLDVTNIFRVNEELRHVRKEESILLKNKESLFLIFYDKKGEEILRVPTSLIQKSYLKKILRILNVHHLHF